MAVIGGARGGSDLGSGGGPGGGALNCATPGGGALNLAVGGGEGGGGISSSGGARGGTRWTHWHSGKHVHGNGKLLRQNLFLISIILGPSYFSEACSQLLRTLSRLGILGYLSRNCYGHVCKRRLSCI